MATFHTRRTSFLWFQLSKNVKSNVAPAPLFTCLGSFSVFWWVFFSTIWHFWFSFFSAICLMKCHWTNCLLMNCHLKISHQLYSFNELSFSSERRHQPNLAIVQGRRRLQRDFSSRAGTNCQLPNCQEKFEKRKMI